MKDTNAEYEKIIKEKHETLSSMAGSVVHPFTFRNKLGVNPTTEIGKKISQQFGITVKTKLHKNKQGEEKMEEKNLFNREGSISDMVNAFKKALIEYEEEKKKIEQQQKKAEEEEKAKIQKAIESQMPEIRKSVEKDIISKLASYCSLNPNDPRCNNIEEFGKEIRRRMIKGETPEEILKFASEKNIISRLRGQVLRESIVGNPRRVAEIINEQYQKNPEHVKIMLETLCKEGECSAEIKKLILNTEPTPSEEKTETVEEKDTKNPFRR